MSRAIAAFILAVAFLLVIHFAAYRPQSHPLLIDAAWPAGGPWCDINHPPAPSPRVRKPFEPRTLYHDQRSVA